MQLLCSCLSFHLHLFPALKAISLFQHFRALFFFCPHKRLGLMYLRVMASILCSLAGLSAQLALLGCPWGVCFTAQHTSQPTGGLTSLACAGLLCRAGEVAVEWSHFKRCWCLPTCLALATKLFLIGEYPGDVCIHFSLKSNCFTVFILTFLLKLMWW